MVDRVDALSLARECRDLEERYKSTFTWQILSAEEPANGLDIIRKAQEHIIKKNQTSLAKVSSYQ